MINKNNIHNSAILKPRFVKCKTFQTSGAHSYVVTKEGYQQCVDCGKIKPTKD